MKNHLIYILLSIFSLPLFIIATFGVQRLLTKASSQSANIVIDTTNLSQPILQSWSAFAQGGEEPPPMLSSVVSQIRKLSPKYIRLDHIYDYYSIVKKENNKFIYDFSILDKTIDDIVVSGALPFLSLSYMPKEFTATGSVIDYPSDWNDWKDLIKATISHISGKNNRNLINIYYEIWNEPELPQFGNWKLGGNKDYRLLYYYASLAAGEVIDVNKFYLGGPAVGSYYSSWVNDFLSYIEQNNLRLDFYSWHRYHKNPSIYTSDAQNIRRILLNFPRFSNIPLILSEWGIDSENSSINNSIVAASYNISAISQFQDKINLAFSFEIKDGPPPNGGKWGLISHERANPPLFLKPKYYAFDAMSKLSGQKISVSGEGKYVKVLASKFQKNIYVILSNFDISGKNTENVPVTITGLRPLSYNLKYSYILDDTTGNYEIITTNGIISKSFIMPPNSVLLLELSPIANIATFIPGVSGNNNDKSLVLKNNLQPMVFTYPEFHLLPLGEISFDIKPLWENLENQSFLIFEAPFVTEDNNENKLFLMKQFDNNVNSLVFGISKEKELISISRPGDRLNFDTWHHIYLSWSPTGLSLSIDDQNSKMEIPIDVRNGKSITFYPIDAAIDNLKISAGNQSIGRSFDNNVDK